MIRSFEFRDFTTLRRYRQRGLFLESIPTLTWGRGLVSAGAVLSPISGALGVFTSLYKSEDNRSEPVIAQVTHLPGSPFARFTYIAPDSAVESPALSPLLEHLIRRVGERGARHLVAEVDEKTHTFEALRRAAFSIYTRQHIWRLAVRPAKPSENIAWRGQQLIDEINLRKLHNAVVPTLVQQVEPAPWEHARSWVLYQQGELAAFADVTSGPRGVYVQPIIHPEVGEVEGILTGLLHHLAPKKRRPVYVCLRSYLSWLSSALEDVGADPGSSQAVMVRRLAVDIKKPALASLPQINGTTEPTTTFYQNESAE